MKSITTWCKNHGIWIIIFFLTACSVSAQNVQKKTYTSDLDSLWSRSTYINKMTTDGKWVVLTEDFDTKENILYLKHTTDTITFKFPESQWVSISDNNRWFGCITSNKELNIVNLEKRNKETYTNIQSYGFSKSGDYIAAYQKNTEATEAFLVLDLNKKVVSSFQGVKKHVWHPKQNSLLVTAHKENKNKVEIYGFDDLSTNVLKTNENSTYNHLTWSESGNSVVFSEQLNQENYLHFYQLNGELKTLGNTVLENKFPEYQISNQSPYISNDGKKILFYRQFKKDDIGEEKETIEVWNTETPWIYPKMKEYEERELQHLLTAWYPETNEVIEIETKDKPTATFNVNHNYAIVYDKLKYEPMYKEFPNADIYVKNMKSGKENLVVQNQYTGAEFVMISPYGKYIVYFKNKHWWIYDIKKNQTINLTKDLKISFENFEKDFAGDVFHFGKPEWSTNDEFVILYDQYDIWLMSPNGNYKERITKGREKNIKYRINKDHYRNNFHFFSGNGNFPNYHFNLDNKITLEMYEVNLHRTGYALWNPENKIKTIIFENGKTDEILISEDFRNVIFRKQKFNEPPCIYNLNLENNGQHLIYQSNKELLNYDLGRAELIRYKIGEKTLSASLLYPANFDPLKNYPMIVSIYEKLSGKLNVFDPPSDYNYIGFNTLKYTTNDYFILYPDISFVIQEPGTSALNCVSSAVTEALESGFIDKNKIGLIGHSFGGYQSTFIATQTDMFAAVVAGASVTDFTSHYHSVGWNWNQPEMWRYENQQWRMGGSYYNIKNAYLRNSPIHHVENLKTPLLLWAGKEDYQVNWTQSIEMFLALKRLDKKSTLLMFENEAHVLMNKNNQKKLSIEILRWFDRHCK